MKKRELLKRIEALEDVLFPKTEIEQDQPEIIPAEPLREMPEEGDLGAAMFQEGGQDE